MIKVGTMQLTTMADVTRHIEPEDQPRIDAIKREMRDKQRGYELAFLRKSQGLTQARVAEVMGVSHARISQIERGRTHLDISTIAAYLHTIGGELNIVATVGNVSVRL
jgi:DNA-binding XRE family transcriptional regulator